MELKYDEKFGETFSKVWKNEYWEEDVVDLIQALGKTSSDLSKQRQFVYKAVQMLLRSLAEYYGVKPKGIFSIIESFLYLCNLFHYFHKIYI